MYVLTWRAQVSRQLDWGKKLFNESEKLTLKLANGTLCSVRWIEGFVTAASLPSYVIVFVLRCRCPHWPRIYSALITDCGCMLINGVIPKDKNRQGFDVSAWQSSVVTYSLGDDPR